MATKLDQKSRVIGYWKTLGQQLKISGEKLKEIECGQFNPTLALMEYLYSEQADLKVKEFYKVVENLKRGDVLNKLDPSLAGEFNAKKAALTIHVCYYNHLHPLLLTCHYISYRAQNSIFSRSAMVCILVVYVLEKKGK